MLCRMAQRTARTCGRCAPKTAPIGTVIDYLEPYFADPRKWSKEQVAEFQNDGYTFCFCGWPEEAEYVALFENWNIRRRLAQLRGSDGRPMEAAPTRPGTSTATVAPRAGHAGPYSEPSYASPSRRSDRCDNFHVRTIIEPFRIKSVEPLHYNTAEEREHYLEEAATTFSSLKPAIF